MAALKKMTLSVLGLCVFPCSTERAEGGAFILPPSAGVLLFLQLLSLSSVLLCYLVS